MVRSLLVHKTWHTDCFCLCPYCLELPGWIFFAALCAAAGIGTLFGLGMLAVLLAQGYPMAGITLGLLGLNVSLFSAAGLGLSFIWRKRTSRNLLETGTRETELSLYRDCSWEGEEDHA